MFGYIVMVLFIDDDEYYIYIGCSAGARVTALSTAQKDDNIAKHDLTP